MAGILVPISKPSGVISTSYADKFVCDGVTTVFTLSAVPGLVNSLDVSINGSTQVPTTDYTVSVKTFTMTSPPPAGAVLLVRYNEALQQDIADSNNVSYHPAGTGAVATTVQSKLRESVSVKDFGAVGDGVTDDTAAINAAITFIGSGGKLIFEANKIYAHTGITVSTLDVTFEGANSGNIANANSFATVLLYTGTIGDGVTFNNVGLAVRNINLINIAFQAATTGASVAVNNCAHLHIQGCRIQNNSTSVMGAGTGLSLVDVFQCSVKDSQIVKSNATARATGSVGVSISRSIYTVFGSYVFSNTTIANFLTGVAAGNQTAVDATGYISNINFIGCDWSACGYGAHIGGGTNNTTFIGCYIEGCTAEGIGVYYDAKNVKIDTCLFNNSGAGVVADVRLGKGAIGDASRNFIGISVTNNFFKAVTAIGVQIYGNTGVRDVIVEGNYFVLGVAAAKGIVTAGVVTNTGTGVQDVLDAVIKNNTFSGFVAADEISLGSSIKEIKSSGVYQGNFRTTTQTGLVTLAPTSDKIQRFISTAAAFAVKLPLATSAIAKEFLIINDATSTKNVVVQDNAGVALQTLTPGQRCLAWTDDTNGFASLLA